VSSATFPHRRPLRVLVVDDSATVRMALAGILSPGRGFEVTTASDPLIAMAKMARVRPDVIVTDLEMPRMDGITFLRRIMAEDPIPVLVCSALTGRGTEGAMLALDEGAVDVVTKPKLAVRQFLEESAVTLGDAVRAAAGARLRLRPRGVRPAPRLAADAVVPLEGPARVLATTDTVVAVGASTGGTEALRVVLEALPPTSPGLVVVQHMPEGFTRAFAQRLDQSCRIAVKEAADGDRVLEGRALIAPGNRHLMVQRCGGHYSVSVKEGPLVSRHRPSVDVLFRSVVQAAGRNSIGVLMTGMGDDGAQGLAEMRAAGARTLAQDEASCVVFGMPREAIARGGADEVVGLKDIAERILTLAAGRTTPRQAGSRPASS
jgi:two-component system, chemotaxis family, protein-glutamate methylesterase/glutaminase